MRQAPWFPMFIWCMYHLYKGFMLWVFECYEEDERMLFELELEQEKEKEEEN